MTYLFLPFLLLIATVINAQDLHPLEATKGHYATLQQLEAAANSSRFALDKVKYPLTDGNSGNVFVGAEPTYLTSAQVTQLQKSVAFPANSSEQTRAELDFLLEWQKNRTTAQMQRAREIARVGYWPPVEASASGFGYNVSHLFWEYKEVVGKQISQRDYPATSKLLAGVTRDIRIVEFTIKYNLLRARPYHLEPRLQPMARISSPSFASGHTLWAYVQAFTWSHLLPAKRSEFLNIAYEVGESREIMGIHYPSDEEAARVLAHKALQNMWTSSKFQEDLHKALEEWEQ